MGYQTIRIDHSNGIATITLSRPEKLNAFSRRMAEELRDAWRTLDLDPEVRVIVLTGAGRAFCAGADVEEFRAGAEGTIERSRKSPVVSEINAGPLIVNRLTKPMIAAINGVAIGVGLTMTLACDIRVAAQSARMGAAFVQMGLVPEYGSTYTLPRLVGIAKACELVLMSKPIDAAEAKAIGLVNEVVPDEALATTVGEMAGRVASLPPLAVQMAKRLLYQGLGTSLASQVQQEELALDYCLRTEDHLEAVRAFLEKRPAHYRGC